MPRKQGESASVESQVSDSMLPQSGGSNVPVFQFQQSFLCLKHVTMPLDTETAKHEHLGSHKRVQNTEDPRIFAFLENGM